MLGKLGDMGAMMKAMGEIEPMRLKGERVEGGYKVKGILPWVSNLVPDGFFFVTHKNGNLKWSGRQPAKYRNPHFAITDDPDVQHAISSSKRCTVIFLLM